MAATTFVSVPAVGLSVDAGTRTISGVVLPYGQVGAKDGARFRFARGSLRWADVGRVKLLRDHDIKRPVGRATALVDAAGGVEATFRVAKGREGDEALELAADGVLDGLSVGVDFDAGQDADPDPKDRGVLLVRRADLREVSLTAMPAFDDARVTRVAASKETAMPETTETTETPAEASEVFTLDQIARVRALFTGEPAVPVERPAVVDPTRRAGDRVVEDWTVGPPPLMPDRDQLVELARAVSERRPVRIAAAGGPGETFAAVTTTETGRTRNYLGGRAGLNPLRIAELVGIPTDNVGLGGQGAYPIFGAGAAGEPAEGALKTEYDAITPGTATPQVIAVWTDMTDPVQSLPNFESKLRNKLARLVAVAENERLRATVAGTAGIGSQVFTAGDQAVQILRAAATIEAGVGVRPDLMLFNPADTATIFGSSVANAAPQEIAELSVKVFGMIGLPMSTQPAGVVLVGAWAAASTLVVGQGLTYMVDPYTQMKNNIVTLLAEEAVALAVEEPTAFTSVDIVTP